MEHVKHVLDVYHDFMMILLITVGSLVTGGRPHITTSTEFGIAFFSNLSWVALVVTMADYFGFPPAVSTVLGFSIGRWSYLLDGKVKSLIDSISWDLISGWRK